MTMLKRPEGHTPEELAFSRRRFGGLGALGALMFSGYAPAALAQASEPIITPADGLVVETAVYEAPDGFALNAYVARPEGEGPFPVIVVASEIFGLHAYIQDVCRRLAHAGYAAVAPAFFTRVEDPAPLTDFARIRQIVAAASHAQVMGDINATLDWIRQRLWADSERLGITGFCWGGKVVWQAVARFSAFRAGVAWYGSVAPRADLSSEAIEQGRPWPVDLAADLKAPVLGLYGELDAGIPLATVEAMNEALARAGNPDSEIIVAPGADHGFHADYRATYDAAAAADGWRRMLAHFHTLIGGSR